MSPEQARGETDIGPAADLYSFGVIMYEMLVGEVPIKADNYNQLIYRVMNGDYARPRTKRPDLPPALEDLVMRAMALDPAQRPQTANELEHALLAFCRAGFRDHMVERISQSNIGFKSSSPLLPTAAPHKKASKLPIVIAVVATLGVAGAVIAATQRTQEEKPAPAKIVMPSNGPAVEPPPPTPPAPPPVEVKEPEKVTLRFDVEPKTAVVSVDGNALDGAELEVEKDDKPHKLSITAKGFQPYEEEVSFSETQKLVVKLDKVGQKPTVRPKKPPRTTKPKDGKPTFIDTKSPYD
jgi:serine/threonine protein kinase